MAVPSAAASPTWNLKIMGYWVQLTDADALAPSAPERKTVAGWKGADDLGDIVAESIETFRDAIRSSGQPLGPDGTLPPGLKQYALDRAVWIFLTRGVPKNDAFATAARSDAAKRAEDILGKLMDGTLKVVGDDPTQTISHGVATVRRGVRMHTHSFDKLGET
ncbi:MAG: hypothetical protein KGL39_17770 [Patescibacteria group bacterium]|nr:hypothetical protein [Patescibacteria group bacterium]